mgnify:CR=1 FL=1
MIRSVETDAGVLEVRDKGPRSGPPVLLLHGFPQDSRCWNEVVPFLTKAGLRSLAPDQRGYAPGAVPKDVSAYRVDALVADAVSVLDSLGLERAHVVGHDWGGAVAWRLGTTQPERVASLTVLSTPHPRALMGSMTRSLQPLRSWYTIALQVPMLPELVLSKTLVSVLRLSGLPLHLARQYAEQLSSPSDLFGPLAWYRAVPRRMPWQLLGGGSGGSARQVAVPTTYVWGAHDPVLGRAAAEATGDQVSGDYRFIELDAGHWLPELHAQEVAEAIVHRVRSV